MAAVKKRIKLTLTRADLPQPLSIYCFPEAIAYFVVCACEKNCEIQLYMTNGQTHYIDNTRAHLKLLGAL